MENSLLLNALNFCVSINSIQFDSSEFSFLARFTKNALKHLFFIIFSRFSYLKKIKQNIDDICKFLSHIFDDILLMMFFNFFLFINICLYSILNWYNPSSFFWRFRYCYREKRVLTQNVNFAIIEWYETTTKKTDKQNN